MHYKHENFWLECSVNAENPADDKTIYVEKLDKMTQEDFMKIVHANPNRYSSYLYHLWGDEQKIIQKFSKNKIDCRKYQYIIVTNDFIEILKATKAAPDELQLRWFNKITGKQKGDDILIGKEMIPNITAAELAVKMGLDPKKYPYDGCCQGVRENHKFFIQPIIKHRLDFKKYHYEIINCAKGLNCAEWDKWLPI